MGQGRRTSCACPGMTGSAQLQVLWSEGPRAPSLCLSQELQRASQERATSRERWRWWLWARIAKLGTVKDRDSERHACICSSSSNPWRLFLGSSSSKGKVRGYTESHIRIGDKGFYSRRRRLMACQHPLNQLKSLLSAVFLLSMMISLFIFFFFALLWSFDVIIQQCELTFGPLAIVWFSINQHQCYNCGNLVIMFQFGLLPDRIHSVCQRRISKIE